MKAFAEFLRRHLDSLLVLVAAVNIAARHFFTLLDPRLRPDTASYFHAWEHISAGSIDPFRTPLYPLLTAILPGWLLLAAQHALFLLSVYCLARIARATLRLPAPAVAAATLPYCLFGLYPMYAALYLTDSLGASMMLIFIMVFFRSIDHPSGGRTAASAAMMTALTALRPIFLFIPLATCALAAALAAVRRAAAAKAAGVAAGICLLIVGAYAVDFRCNTGHYGISTASELNKALVDLYSFSPGDSASYPVHNRLKTLHDNLAIEPVEKWDVLFITASDHPKELYDEVGRYRAAKPGRSAEALRTIISANLRRPLAGSAIPIAVLPLVAAAYIVFTALMRRRLRRATVPRVFIWLLFTGNFMAVILGAPGEYPRLLMPVIPLVFLMAADMAAGITTAGKSLLKGNRGPQACASPVS